jgi:hypothetical protein
MAAVGVLMAIDLVDHQKQIDALSAIDADAAWVNRTAYAPDLASWATDAQAQLKLLAVFLPFTLLRTRDFSAPGGYDFDADHASTAALPAHQSSDPIFSITPLAGGPATLQSTWNYRDLGGTAWSAGVHGGWFVQHQTGNANDPGSITTTINLKLSNGDRGSIGRAGNSLLATDLDSKGPVCPADPATGLTPNPYGRGCGSVVAPYVDVMDANNNAVRLQIVPPPAFTSSSTATFDPSGAANQQFTITATNNASINLIGTLPAGVTFTPGNGQATLTLTNPPGAVTDSRTVSLTAFDITGGSGTQSLTVSLLPHLQIVSPNSATFTIGVHGTFNVQAAGPGPLHLTAKGLGGGDGSAAHPYVPLPAGMVFADLGGGFAEIDGTPLPGATGCIGAVTGCGITVTQGTGASAPTAFQTFTLTMVPPPAAQYSGPASTSFVEGVASQFNLIAQGAKTKVTWTADPLPSWLSLSDNGLGTATLSGTPPVGNRGPVPLTLHLATYGVPNSATVVFVINVVAAPKFTSPNSFTCTIPAAGGTGPCSFTVITNQGASSGTAITYTGGLPPGAAFTDNGNGTATVQGNVGVGGSYALQFNAANSTGAATQFFYLRVQQPPSLISASSATFQIGMNNVANVMASGYPSHPEGALPGGSANSTGLVLSMSGAIPPWLRLTPASSSGLASGMAMLSGTPPAGSQGNYSITLNASNQVAPDAAQTFTINVVGPGAMTRQTILQGGGSSGESSQGAAVALSADGQTAIVGGPTDNSGAGAFWLYTSNGIDFTANTKFTATGNNGFAALGSAVALAPDGQTAVAGGPGMNSFWVFSKNSSVTFDSSGNWKQVAGPVSNAGAGGVAVMTGAVPQFIRIITGDPQNNRFWEWLQDSPGHFTWVNVISPSDAVGTALFGTSVSLSADGNTLLVGGPGDNSNAGAAWIFTNAHSSWTQVAKLTGSGAAGSAHFGTSVALSADGHTAVVGGPADSSNAGAMWVFTNSGGTWSAQGGKLTANDATGAAQFGSSVAVSNDGRIAMGGGPQDNSGAGASWFFVRNNNAWSQSGGKEVATSGAPSGAWQGSSVALSGSGNNAVTGGSHFNFNPGTNRGVGAAWAWHTPDLTISLSHNGTFLPGQTGTYTVTLGNSGDDWTPPGVSWNLALPVNLTSAGIAGPAGWSCTATGCISTTGLLAPGDSAVFTAGVNVTGTGTATATATVTGRQLNTANDSASDTTVIGKATPVLRWNAPAAITYGSALGSGQLNATASVPGTFVYTPPAGTVLPVGNNQTLSANFVPNDPANYNGGSVSTTINVLAGTGGGTGTPAKLVITQTLARGTGSVVVATLTIADTGGTAAQNVTLTSAKIGTTSGTPIPLALGTVNAGGSIQGTITFPAAVGVSGAAGVLSLAGTYTGGTISSSARIVLP